jgi:LacI family transcriptional regulator
MSVTIKDIARLAGVSYSTVSKALNNSPLVRTEKKQRIRELAKQLGYQPNMVAKSLVSKRSMSIGIVLPSFDSSATGVLLEHVHNELLRRRYDVVLSMLPTEAAIDFFLRQRVDGIIAFEDLRPTTVANRMTTELPMVSIGSAPVFSSRYALIDTKRKDAIRQAVRYLHGRGHRSIAYVGVGTEDHPTQYEKVIGFLEEAAARAIPREGSVVIDTKGVSWTHGYAAGRQCALNAQRPSSYITGSYEVTVGFMQAMRDHGLECPEHYSIICYDDVPELAFLPVPITVVGTRCEKYAERVVSILLDQISRDSAAQLIELLDATIIERSSCKTV